MKCSMDISVEVECADCGSELDVKDVTDYKSAELTVQVSRCEKCLDLLREEIEKKSEK